jgi:pimeloyl-ACP methyl ester carboxylesterase
MWSQTAIREFGTPAPKARTTVVLDNCGHGIQQEQPEKVNNLLPEFLSEL